MQQDISRLMTPILDIIEYQEDREALFRKIALLMQEVSVMTIYQSLPTEKQEEFLRKIEQDTRKEHFKEIFTEYIPQKMYEEIWQETLTKAFQEYLTSILPLLTQDQVTRIEAHLSSLAVTES